jgi:glucosyl-3-phosphoglycerate synthase
MPIRLLSTVMRSEFQHPEILDWFDRRTFGPSNPGPFMPDPGQLAELKRESGLRVSVCLPALNEQTTIGAMCTRIRVDLMETVNLVDELVVIDSGSEDDTLDVAAAAGAEVHSGRDVMPEVGHVLGKGEALWKSLAVTSGDLICWCDSDIRNFDSGFVVGLLTPLLLDAEIKMSKGFYKRPLDGDPTGGGRVTELVVRPLLHLLYPKLTGLVQPLSGEYALRRDVALELPFFTHYAVDIGLLIDLVERYGLNALAQVDLGVRLHRKQDTLSLGKMSHQIMRGVLHRLDELGRIKLTDDLSDALVQFIPKTNGPLAVRFDQEIIERPAMATYLLQT